MAPSRNDGAVIIKKYANRRLYNTESSSYITLDHLAAMVRDKKDFQVLDAKSGDDITHNVLTQIIMEEEANGTSMLPVNFLRQLIGMYGDSMQGLVPQYLEASLEAFGRNQSQLRDAMAGAFNANPFAELAKRNLEMFAAATGVKSMRPTPAPEESDARAELDELKTQMRTLQEKLDKLG